MMRFGCEADGIPVFELKADGKHYTFQGQDAVTMIRAMLEKGKVPEKQRRRAEKILAAEDTLQELNKRWDAAIKEILSHEGKAIDWHTVSEDGRAIHWALYLDDTLKERAQQEGVAYELDLQYYWQGMVLHGIRSFFKIPVDLDDLPPSFTDPIDGGSARFRKWTKDELAAVGFSE
jgi:hypothetical protein